MTSIINPDYLNTMEDRALRHIGAPIPEKDLSFKNILIPKFSVWLFKKWIGSCRNLVIGFEENVESRQKQGLGSIGCFWHCNILMFTFNFVGYTTRVLISEHGDGELIAQACLRMGVSTIRGSTTRGGARALVQLRKFLKDGDDLLITPDGPRGPSKEFQLGAIYLAAKTGEPIIPCGCYGDRLIQFKSWDRFRLPRPFSKNVLRWGEPVFIPKEALDDPEPWKRLLEAKMKEEEDKCRHDLTRTLVGIPRGIWSLRR